MMPKWNHHICRALCIPPSSQRCSRTCLYLTSGGISCSSQVRPQASWKLLGLFLLCPSCLREGSPSHHLLPLAHPGQVTQLRIFEKRYQLLMRHLLDRGGCFGFPVASDMGITAVVKRSVAPLFPNSFPHQYMCSLTLSILTDFSGTCADLIARYRLHDSEFYVLVEGGHRFSYRKGARGCRVLPGTFGLSSVNAPLMHDK